MARRVKKLAAKTAYAYLRMSMDEQTLSPEAQRAAIETFAARNSIEIVQWFEDLGMSGGLGIDERPGLLACLDGMHGRKASILLIAKHDRLARDEYTSAMAYRLVERAGGQVMSADGVGNGGSPEDRLMRSIVAAFAAYERALIRYRTKSALKVKAARGERVGQIPYGFEQGPQVGVKLRDGKAVPVFSVVPNKTEQVVIDRIRKMSTDGVSYPVIVSKLTEEGVPARGSRWHVTTVGRIVRREAA